jgi:diguanylate cyclase (GGDEF)-like protein
VSQGPTIGVLSTSFGGPYFGGLMGAIAARVADAGGRLVAVQTLGAGAFETNPHEPPTFTHRVAWEHVAGFVVVLNAVDGRYLDALRESGRPVVVVSSTPSGFDCPFVMPDNRGGVRQAVEHLIQEHGHRRIAFVGYMGQHDPRERRQAWHDTLLEHGLMPDGLFFDAGNMQQTGGERAARTMIDAGLPATAVVAANDENATGLIRALSAAGVDVPRDVSVIGFDDTEEGAHLTPALSSVRQPLEDVGDLATTLLLRLIESEKVSSGVHLVATSLTVRESCGCSRATWLDAGGSGPARPLRNEAELLAGMSTALNTRLAQSVQRRMRAALVSSAQSITNALRASIEGDDELDVRELRRTLAPLSGVLSSNHNLVAVRLLIRRHGHDLLAQSGADRDVDGLRRVEDRLHEIFTVLGQLHTAQQAVQATSMMANLGTQYLISMELLRDLDRDPRSLDWLRLTDVQAGCLGLWPARDHLDHIDPDTDDRWSRLDVVSTYNRGFGSSPGVGETAVTRFPPADIVGRADISSDDMVYVVPLNGGPGEWGMLALVGPVQAGVLEARENMNQWAALLAVALSHESTTRTLRNQDEHLRRAALFDELTGLPNRTFFRDRLTLAVARAARRPSYRYAVLMLDLDGFKLVNDSLGHQAGDRLLQQVAMRIAADLRVIDTAARFGGDEFAVLLEEIRDVEGTLVLVERLQRALQAPYDLNGQEVVLSAGIGIVLGTRDYEDPEDVIRDADAAMYYAKARGQRGHALFDPSMHATAIHRLRLEGELRRALDNDELELHYQPIVDLGSGTVTGAEALIRWQHPTRGLVPPVEFLPVAEASGLILPIGDRVLEQACAQLRQWDVGERPEPFMLSINVSNRQFWLGGLAHDVATALAAHGLPASSLAIEITEGVIMHDVKLASNTLADLHALGVQVHIDDFGTGYSSLEALHDLTLDALKIDRSFVSRLTDNPRSRELVRTIVKMGLNLGLDVIAEGIETTRELELVRELGCTHGQGYLFSRPAPAATVAPFIGSRLLTD